VAVTVGVESTELGGGVNSTDVAVTVGKGRVGDSQMLMAIWLSLLTLLHTLADTSVMLVHTAIRCGCLADGGGIGGW